MHDTIVGRTRAAKPHRWGVGGGFRLAVIEIVDDASDVEARFA